MTLQASITFGAATIPTPTHWWKFEESSGTRYDAVADNDLTDANSNVTRVTGKDGYGASFDRGASPHTYLAGTAVDVRTGDWTISGWYNSTSGVSTVVSQWDDGADNLQFLICQEITTAGKLTAYIYDGGYPYVEASAADATLHHFVCWFSTADQKLYLQVDGGTVNSVSTSGPSDGESLAPLWFGGHNSTGRWLTGLVDEVGIWKEDIGADARAALWNNGDGTFYPW